MIVVCNNNIKLEGVHTSAPSLKEPIYVDEFKVQESASYFIDENLTLTILYNNLSDKKISYKNITQLVEDHTEKFSHDYLHKDSSNPYYVNNKRKPIFILKHGEFSGLFDGIRRKLDNLRSKL